MWNFDRIVEHRVTKAILVCLLVIIAAFVRSLAQDRDTIGYLIVETTPYEINVLKTTEMGFVRTAAERYYVNADSLLAHNNYFQIKTDWNKLYVERKLVVCKNGKQKYRKIK